MLSALDPYDLDRFVHAQAGDMDRALTELRSGLKRTHWMWYVFPQLDGLGRSSMARRYAITGIAEVEAFLKHPVLGPRLTSCARALLGIDGKSARDILGSPDDLKLRSCATLFAQVSNEPVFGQLLEKFFDGQPDGETLRLLRLMFRP